MTFRLVAQCLNQHTAISLYTTRLCIQQGTQCNNILIENICSIHTVQLLSLNITFRKMNTCFEVKLKAALAMLSPTIRLCVMSQPSAQSNNQAMNYVTAFSSVQQSGYVLCHSLQLSPTIRLCHSLQLSPTIRLCHSLRLSPTIRLCYAHLAKQQECPCVAHSRSSLVRDWLLLVPAPPVRSLDRGVSGGSSDGLVTPAGHLARSCPQSALLLLHTALFLWLLCSACSSSQLHLKSTC
jgi:hypothetical protein